MLCSSPDAYNTGGGTHGSDLYALGAEGRRGEIETDRQLQPCRIDASPPSRLRTSIVSVRRGQKPCASLVSKSRINLHMSERAEGRKEGGLEHGQLNTPIFLP